jgi:hypothetical protein
MSDTKAYKEGKTLGDFMRRSRENDDFSYDCRWDLADAAKQGTDFFNDFKRGLDDGLGGS